MKDTPEAEAERACKFVKSHEKVYGLYQQMKEASKDWERDRIVADIAELLAANLLTWWRPKRAPGRVRGPYRKTFSNRMTLYSFVGYHRILFGASCRGYWRALALDYNRAYSAHRTPAALKRSYLRHRAQMQRALFEKVLASWAARPEPLAKFAAALLRHSLNTHAISVTPRKGEHP